MFCQKDVLLKRHFTEGTFHRSCFAKSSILLKRHFAETHFAKAISPKDHFAEAISPKMIEISLL
jgi:hypothetical protein